MVKVGDVVEYRNAGGLGVALVLKTDEHMSFVLNHNMNYIMLRSDDDVKTIPVDASGMDIFEVVREMKDFLHQMVKPSITEAEKNLLSVLECDAYVVRNRGGKIVVHAEKPEKKSNCWISEGNYIELRTGAFIPLEFKAVRWEDEEPWMVSDLYALEVK